MEWISVKEKMPEEFTEVLTSYKFGTDHKCCVDYIITTESEPRGFFWGRRIESDQDDVTHWMPLPEPPT